MSEPAKMMQSDVGLEPLAAAALQGLVAGGFLAGILQHAQREAARQGVATPSGAIPPAAVAAAEQMAIRRVGQLAAWLALATLEELVRSCAAPAVAPPAGVERDDASATASG